jgi:hypothetical protein
MHGREGQPRELSTARGNFVNVRVSLATGRVEKLDNAEAAREAAEARRRAATKNRDVPIFASSSS